MARIRDHKKAYAARIARGEARGLTRSQARGHPRKGETYVSRRAGASRLDRTLEEGIRRLRRGDSVTAAARDLGVSRERLSTYAKQVAGAERQGGRWTLNDQRVRRVPIIAKGEPPPTIIHVHGFEAAHLVGQHFHEASRALLDPDLVPHFQRRWEGVRVKDTSGRWHTFSTDLNDIFVAFYRADKSFEEIYRIAVS
jgi:hypothetical protein